MLSVFLLAAVATAAAPVPSIQRLENLARSIKSSYCPTERAEGRILARADAGDDVKWILTEDNNRLRLSLGSIEVDELLERMTENPDQVTFGDFLEDDFAETGGEDVEEDAEEFDENDNERPRLDVSRLHSAFHDLAGQADSAYAALLAHLSEPCAGWSRWLGRCQPQSVEIAGHGLGGALAVLIADHVPHTTTVTTFGMPALLSESEDQRGHEHWANGLDPVVRFLPGAEGRRYMKNADEHDDFQMTRARLDDHHLVHGVSLEC